MTLKLETRQYTPGYGAQTPGELPTEQQMAHIPDRIVLFSTEVPAYLKANEQAQVQLQNLNQHQPGLQPRTK